MTTATSTSIHELVAQLRTRLDALGDGGDAKSENERRRYRVSYDFIQRTISGLVDAPGDVARQEAYLKVCYPSKKNADRKARCIGEPS